MTAKKHGLAWMIDQVSLRTLVLAALLVWGAFALVWYLLLHDDSARDRAALSTTVASESVDPQDSRPSGTEPPSERFARSSDTRSAIQEPQEPSITQLAPEFSASRSPGYEPLQEGSSTALPNRSPAGEATAGRNRPQPVAEGQAVVQVGAFSSTSRAEGLAEELQRAGWPAYLESDGEVHRVLVGPYADRREAELALGDLRRRGFEGFVKQR